MSNLAYTADEAEVPAHAPDAPAPAQALRGGDAAEAGELSELAVRQYVTFIAGDEVFAVEMTPVQEIIRVPQVVRVPLCPPTLEGLANLRGQVLPIVSLRRALGFDEREVDDNSRAVVIDIGQPMGFVVDKVASVVGVEARQIEDVAGISSSVDADLLSGIIKGIEGHPMVMVLNFEKLVRQEFAHIAAMKQRRDVARQVGSTDTASIGQTSADKDAASDQELHLVSFEVDAQEYAIAIENVQEIVQIPSQIIQVPRAQSHVLGVMTLRNRLLPLVALRRMFGLSEQAVSEQSRIVVIAIGAASVGLVVDKVNAVLRVPHRDVQSMPSLLSQGGDMADITDMCQLDGGKRLVSVVATDRLFQHAVIKDALATMNPNHADQGTQAGTQAASQIDEQVVVLRLGTEEFGVPIDSVQEIVRVPETLTHVPKAPPAVEGVINLRGAVLPVVDLRRRLGLNSVARHDGQRIVVFQIRGALTGFIVDAVLEVLKVPVAAIERSPSVSNAQSDLLARMANLEKSKRILQLIDPAHLLAEGELSDLAVA
jgi:purine-binding chemotaxis protein CheW